MLPIVTLALAIAGNGAAPQQGNGVVEGALLYPACHVPADLEVCAEGETTICTRDLSFVDGDIGYRLELPAGEYRIFARADTMLPGVRAYYSEAVKCGLDVDCTDHEPITIDLRAGARVTSIHPADWAEPESPTLLSYAE